MGHTRRFGQLAFAVVLAALPTVASAADCLASTFAEFVTCAGAGAASDTITLTANVQPDGTSVVVNADQSVVNNGFLLDGAVGSFQKAGAGALVLPAANTYSAGTIVSGGALVIGDAGSTGTGPIILGGGGGILSLGSFAIGVAGIQFTSNGIIAAAAGQTLQVFNMNLGIGAAATFGDPTNNGTVEIGAIGTVASSSTLTLAGGTVRALDNTMTSLFGIVSSTTLGATALFELNGQDVIVANLLGAGEIAVTSGNALVLYNGTYGGVISGAGNLVKDVAAFGPVILTGTNTYTGPTLILGGTIRVGNGGTTGTLGIGGGVSVVNASSVLEYNRTDAYDLGQGLAGTGTLRVNSGTLTLSVASPYSGPTEVNAGMLVVTASNQLTSGTTVAASGSLKGTGTTGPVQVNVGRLGAGLPGTATGILNVQNSLTLSPLAFLDVDIAGPVAGSGYDQIGAIGTVTLNNPALNVTGAYVPVIGDSFVLIDNDGADPVTGTFNSIPEGTTDVFNGVLMRISYVGGDGNDVTLSVVSHTVTPGAAGPNGTIAPSAPQTVINGGTTSFTITPNANYMASVAGTCGPPAGPSLTAIFYTTSAVTADCTVTPVFTIINHVVTASGGPNGIISPPIQSIDHGSTATFTVTPDANYTATMGGTCPAGSLVGNTYTTGPITAGCSVSATFALNTYTVTPSASANGTITPNTAQVVNHGATTVFTVTPSAGYSAVVGGTCGGNLVGNTFTTNAITADCTVSATFTLNTYTVTPSAGANGTIAPNTAQLVNHGAATAFTVTPSAGYSAVVGGTCGGNLVGNTYTTNAITADCTVSATFTQITFTVTPSAGANGTITPSTPQTVAQGATTTFTVTPNAGFDATVGGTCGGSLAGTTYTTNAITANCTVAATFATVNPPRLGNIATRGQVGTGNDVMIGGFVIGGSTSKMVAIVATGPSLAQFGIANPLANPTLTLVRSSDQAVIATNDDWQAGCPQGFACATPAQLTAAGFAPSNPLEAAILIDLAPGAYTAIVQGVNNGTGVSVIGVYEVDHPEIPLVNIATRGHVLTGNDVLIGGFVIQGSGPQTVAIVATGPSLANFGITNALANPTISVVRSSDQAVLATNDDWQTDAQQAQLQAAGFAPSNALESGLYRTLPPGAYTVIVQGVSGGTGVGVIGVYAVP